MSNDDDELTITLCRFGGPLVLLIASPIYALILTNLMIKEFSAGREFDFSIDIPNIMILVVFVFFGGWMCRKGYGWFGGEKP